MKIYVNHTISMGHRIVGHEGKCQRLHGHTYRFEVHLICDATELVPPGFVVDFGKVKEILDEWDHRMLIWDQDPDFALDGPPVLWDDLGVVHVKFNPTAENMASALTTRFRKEFPHLSTVRVKVWETPSTYAEDA